MYLDAPSPPQKPDTRGAQGAPSTRWLCPRRLVQLLPTPASLTKHNPQPNPFWKSPQGERPGTCCPQRLLRHCSQPWVAGSEPGTQPGHCRSVWDPSEGPPRPKPASSSPLGPGYQHTALWLPWKAFGGDPCALGGPGPLAVPPGLVSLHPAVPEKMGGGLWSGLVFGGDLQLWVDGLGSSDVPGAPHTAPLSSGLCGDVQRRVRVGLQPSLGGAAVCPPPTGDGQGCPLTRTVTGDPPPLGSPCSLLMSAEPP